MAGEAGNFIGLASSMNAPVQGAVKGLTQITDAYQQLPALSKAMTNLNKNLDGSAAQIGEKIKSLNTALDSAKSEQNSIKRMLDKSNSIEDFKKEKKLNPLLTLEEFLKGKEIEISLEEYNELKKEGVHKALESINDSLVKTIEAATEDLKKGNTQLIASITARNTLTDSTGTKLKLGFIKINKMFEIQKEQADSTSDFNAKSIAARMLASTEEGRTFLELMKNRAFKDWDFSQLKVKDVNMANKLKVLRGVATGANYVGGVLSASSGSAANTAISDSISGALGKTPFAGQIYEIIKFLFDRGNELGRKGKDLYEGTAGRYGYGEGFRMGNYGMSDGSGALAYKNFVPTARSLGYKYGVGTEVVETTMKGLSAYTGIKAFKDLENLASKTLAVANATGLATDSVTQLGAAYQKNFGLTAKDSLFTAGSQLLGMMDDVNRGISQNLMLSNTEMAALMTQMTTAAGGIDASKTLIPFIKQAVIGANQLKFSSSVARDELVKLMMDVRLKGGGLPQGLAQFMLIQGGQLKNTLSPQQTSIANQVGRGKFAYEAVRELAATSSNSEEAAFWGNDKFKYREDLADVALKLSSNNLPALLGSLGPDALADLTSKVMELYSIPGAEKVFKVPLPNMLSKFVDFARNNRAGYAALGGKIDKIAGLAEATKVLGAPPGTYTAQQLAAASQVKREFAGNMAPADRLNQLMEKLLGLVDKIALMFVDLLSSPILKIVGGGRYTDTDAIAADLTQGLSPKENREYQKLMLDPNVNQARLAELQNQKNLYGQKTSTEMLGGEVVERTTTSSYNTGLTRNAYLTPGELNK